MKWSRSVEAHNSYFSPLTQSWSHSTQTFLPPHHRDSSVQFSHSVMSDSLPPHGLQHARLSVYHQLLELAHSCLSNQWCHLTITSSAITFFSHLQSFPTSVLPMNVEDWFPLDLTGRISLQSKGLSRVFSNTTAQKRQLSGTQLSLWSNSHIYTWLLEKS